jgi:ketosteroid isomerase-like protein
MKTFYPLLLLGALVACAPSTELTADDLKDIETRRNMSLESMRSADYSKLDQIYAPDCIAFPVDQPMISGLEELKKYVDSEPMEISFVNLSTEGSGSYAVAHGTFNIKFSTDSAEMNMPGKYVEVWKKQADGTWRLYRDIYNMDEPM